MSTHKLFSISTRRNKPPGEISQNPRPRLPQPPVTHTVGGPGCWRLVRPHTSGPRSLQNQLHSTWPPRPPQPSWGGRHGQWLRGGPPPTVVHKERCPGSDQNVTPTRYCDLHSWLIFACFYPSGRSRIPPRKIRQFYFIDVKTIIFFCRPIISFSEVSIPATRCINILGPTLGTVNSEERWPNPRAWYRSTSNGRGLWRFCARRIWTPTSSHARFRAGNREERGPNPWAWYRSTSNRR